MIPNNEQRICSYGFAGLDKITGGLHAGELILIGARPGMGKSIFAYNLANHMTCYDNCSPFLLVSPERPTDNLLRFVKVCAETTFQQHNDGHNSELDYTISTLSVGFDITKIREMYEHTNGVKHPLIIDQVQLTEYSATNTNGTAVDFGSFFAELKQLAAELSIPIVVLAKWPRSCDNRFEHGGDPRPMLSDFSETSLSQDDFDTVIFLHRDDYFTEDGCFIEEGVKKAVEVIIAKSKSQSSCVCTLICDVWREILTEPNSPLF